jgi:hypothetical protein
VDRFSGLFDGITTRIDNSAFLPAPREIIRPLMRCEKRIAKGEWNDAVAILGELLADESFPLQFTPLR